MTSVIAPPPAAIGQLTDLIALFRNLDAVEKLVADLKAATDELNAASVALSKDKEDLVGKLAAAATAEAEADKKAAKLDEKTKAHDAAKAEANVAKAALVAEKSAFDSFVAQAKTDLVEAKAALDAREGALADAEKKVAADHAAVAELKETLEKKLALLRA